LDAVKSGFGKLTLLITRYRFALAAFLIPLGVRAVPEVLSWSYPIGFDTVVYIYTLQNGWSAASLGMVNFLHGTNLFFFLSSLGYELTGNAFVLMKILGPLLLATLAFSMYLYARRGLKWNNWKSLLVAVLVATYFVSLRNSWDMYRQMLGLIFLMAALISLKSSRASVKYVLASVFMCLTVLSHELAAVVLLFYLVVAGVRLLWNRSGRNLMFLCMSAVLPVALFFFQRVSLKTGAVGLPATSVAAEPSVSLALYVGGSLLYCYVFILPLVLYGVGGLKDLALRSWAVLGLGIIVLELFDPNLPFYLWFRWVVLLVYPLLFFAAEGTDRLWHLASFRGRFARLKPKRVVAAFLAVIFILSAFYVSTTPEYACPYFGVANPYLTVIPSSMLQNSISIADNPSTVDCFNWVAQHANNNSVIIAHDAFYYLASVYLPDQQIMFFGTDTSLWSDNPNGLVTADKMASAAQTAYSGGQEVYTFWWCNGKGWYNIESLPSCFEVVYVSGNMAVFVYES
jgi:hypothetical protein